MIRLSPKLVYPDRQLTVSAVSKSTGNVGSVLMLVQLLGSDVQSETERNIMS